MSSPQTASKNGQLRSKFNFFFGSFSLQWVSGAGGEKVAKEEYAAGGSLWLNRLVE
jgi:hypothetical protein